MTLNINGNCSISDNGNYKTGNFTLDAQQYSANLTINVNGSQIVTPEFVKQIIEDPQFKKLLKEQIFKGTVDALIAEGEKK